MELKDFINAASIALYIKELKAEDTLDQALFPPKKQMSTKLEQAKGAKNKPVALRQSTFDVAAKQRALKYSLSTSSTEMPFFKESIGIDETARRFLMNAIGANNKEMVDTILGEIYENYENLVKGAKINMKKMRCQLIQKGVINFTSDDGDIFVDYGVPAEHKETISAAAKKWTNEDADIVGDITRIQKKMTDDGYAKPDKLLMTEKTFNDTVVKNKAITAHLHANPISANTILTQKNYLTFMAEMLSVKVIFLENSTYIPSEGAEEVAYYDDGIVTFMSGSTLGNTVYAPTPEEYDKVALAKAGADVSIVDTAIAITTQAKVDPVTIDTKVSVIGIPSFKRADEVYLLTAY